MAHAEIKSAKNRPKKVSKLCLKICVKCYKYLLKYRRYWFDTFTLYLSFIILSNSPVFGFLLRMTKEPIYTWNYQRTKPNTLCIPSFSLLFEMQIIYFLSLNRFSLLMFRLFLTTEYYSKSSKKWWRLSHISTTTRLTTTKYFIKRVENGKYLKII